VKDNFKAFLDFRAGPRKKNAEQEQEESKISNLTKEVRREVGTSKTENE
jgi:hypothetical protein